MLQQGETCPEFCLKDKDGVEYSLNNFKQDYLVFFFYPKDNTPGCTIESKGFSKLNQDFIGSNVLVIGISGGNEKTKTKFCEKHELETIMLSDTDFKFSEAFGVYGEKSFMGKKYMGISRATFILDKERKVIKVYDKVKPHKHPVEVLEFIRNL